MAGILVQLALSWLLLYLLYRKDLRSLGLGPNSLRLVDVAVGLAIGAVASGSYHALVSWLAKTDWRVNPGFDLSQALESSWWVMRSVLFEEFIFRGALLYIALRLMGPVKACILSAGAFGIYHWFSYGVVGNPVVMAYVFITTGAVGLAEAIAFYRTGSMYLPIALHFGINLVTTVVFSNGPLGQQWLAQEQQDNLRLGTAGSISTALFHILVLFALLLGHLHFRRQDQKGES